MHSAPRAGARNGRVRHGRRPQQRGDAPPLHPCGVEAVAMKPHGSSHEGPLMHKEKPRTRFPGCGAFLRPSQRSTGFSDNTGSLLRKHDTRRAGKSRLCNTARDRVPFMTAIASETQRRYGPAPMFGRRRFFAVRLEGDDAMHMTQQSQREGSAQAYLLRLVQEDKARQQDQSQSHDQPQNPSVD